MVYALFSDGFRAGGRNVTRPQRGLPADYDPDFLDNYELGFKSRWDGGRYTFNLTAFKMEWEDYQVEVVAPPSDEDQPVLYAVMVANVGDAEIEGLSLEFTAFLWDSLDFGLNLQTARPEGNEGQRPRRNARRRPAPLLAGGERRRLGRVHLSRRGRGWPFLRPRPVDLHRQLLNGVSRPRTLQPAYQITDFKVGFDADDWEVYAYVDNLTNERAILYDQNSAPPGTITVNWPRTWGLGFSKSWGGELTTPQKARPRTERVRVQRMRKRGHYDRATIDAILDDGILCHVGFVHEGAPGRHPDALLAGGRLRLPARLGREPHARHARSTSRSA